MCSSFYHSGSSEKEIRFVFNHSFEGKLAIIVFRSETLEKTNGFSSEIRRSVSNSSRFCHNDRRDLTRERERYFYLINLRDVCHSYLINFDAAGGAERFDQTDRMSEAILILSTDNGKNLLVESRLSLLLRGSVCSSSLMLDEFAL